MLYQSTYSTDYLLLPRSRLDEALGCLHSGPRDQPAADGSVGETATAAHAYPLCVLDGSPMHILRLDKTHRQRHTGALIRLLFMPQARDERQVLASLTETADEISLVAGATGWFGDYCRSEAEGLQHDPTKWVPIRVEGVPISVTGVVAAQSRVLANAQLSILYLSTFYSDFTLVQDTDVDCASEAFAQAGLVISGDAWSDEDGKAKAAPANGRHETDVK